MKMKAPFLSAAIVAILAAHPASGQEQNVPLVNPDFSALDVGLAAFPDPDPEGFRVTEIDGWTAFTETMSGVAGDIALSNAAFTGIINPVGTNYFNLGSQSGEEAALIYLVHYQQLRGALPVGLRQTVTTHAVKPNVLYRLTVDVGNIQTDPVYDYDLGGFPGYAIQLVSGTTILAEDDNTLVVPEGEFVSAYIEFQYDPLNPAHVAVYGDQFEIRLLNLNQPIIPDGLPGPGVQVAREVDFDNVVLTAELLP